MSSSLWVTDFSTTPSTTDRESKCYDCSSCCGLNYLRRNKSKTEARCDSTCSSSTTKHLSFSAKLPGDLVLVEGRAIVVEGTILEDCTRIAINLTCQKNPKDPNQAPNIAFHLNPRLDQRYIVRNTRINGSWGEEEVSSATVFPLNSKEHFLICIFIAKEEFLVSINGKHFCAYAYRIPLVNIVGLEVVGKVDVAKVEYRNLDRYPELVNDNCCKRIQTEEEIKLGEETDLILPFTGYLPQEMRVGNEIEIHGRVKVLPHSFYVNLQKGSQIWPHPIIPLHLNPRFKTTIGEHALIRNAWNNGCWGSEERLPGNHFQPGVSFSMMIRKESDKYSLWLSKKLCGEFPFRSDNEEVDVVHIQGDVVIHRIFFRSNKN